MSEDNRTWLTQEAFDRLSEELERRRTTERKEIARRIELARQEGDLRENAGYHAAGERPPLTRPALRCLRGCWKTLRWVRLALMALSLRAP